MHIIDFLFLLSIPKQDQEISSYARSGLSLQGRGHVLIRWSQVWVSDSSRMSWPVD